ncbi:MAG: LamG-like jellyroll fold domain-containing protein [Cyclobacteriaceae bacterium]
MSSILITPGDTVLFNVSFLPTTTGLIADDIEIYYESSDGFEQYRFAVEGIGFEDVAAPGNALGATSLGYMEVGASPVDDFSFIDAFSFEAWVNVSTSGNQTVFENVNTSGVAFGVNDGSLELALVTNSELADLIIESGGPVPGFEWTHIAATYDGSGVGTGMKFYINGEPSGQGTGTSTIVGDINDLPGLNTIGNFAEDGTIDEFRIWNIALTQEQVRQNFLGTVDPSTPGLITYFRFDEELTATDAYDIAGGISGFFTGEFAPGLITSTAPFSDEESFDGLFEKSAIWTASQVTSQSSNLIISDVDFLIDEGDKVVFAHDNDIVGSDERTTEMLSGIENLVDEKLIRNWFLEFSDFPESDGGDLELIFNNIAVDSSQTYFLLSSVDGTEYKIENYNGYIVDNDSVVFRINADSVAEKAFYTLGSNVVFPGNAMAFDGIDDSVRTSGDVSHAEQFTYEAWLKLDADNTTNGGILALNGSFGSFTSLTYNSSGNLAFFASDGGSIELITCPVSISDGLWHHVAIRRDFDGMEILIDGAVVNTQTPQLSAVFFSAPLRLGANQSGTAFGDFDIDELRIWDSKRTDAEIQENMLKTVKPGNPGLVYYSRFDQTDGTLPDLSTNFNAGTLYNFQNDGIESGYILSDAFSEEIIENALDFDGTKNGNESEGDHLSVPHNAALNLAAGDFSLQAWINPRDGINGAILAKGEGVEVSNSDEFIFKLENNKLGLMLSDGNTIEWQYSDLGVTIGAWSHVAAVYSSGSNSVEFFINGISAGFQNYLITPSSNDSSDPMFIGKQGSSCDCNYFDGQIDEVSIWNITLDQGSIQQQILNGIAEDEPNLIAFYDFNIGTPEGDNSNISQIPDVSGKELDADIVNVNMTGAKSNLVTSTAFDFQPALNVIVENEEYFNGEDLNFGVVFENDSIYTTMIFWNDGFVPLTISSPATYGNNMIVEDALTKTVLQPFEGDTLIFIYTSNTTIGPITNESLVSVTSDDPVNPTFNLFQSAVIYPESEGAGNALLLDGISDVAVSSLPTDTLANNSFSVEYWAKRPDNTNAGFVFGNGPVSGTDNEILHVGFRAGNIVTLAFQGDDLNHIWTDANTEWNHFAFTYDQPTKTQKIFINGLEVASRIANNDFTGSGQVYVGSAPFGTNFAGEVDELRVWNKALSLAEIRENLVVKTDVFDDLAVNSLIAYYRFDEDSGEEIFDLAQDNNGEFLNLTYSGSFVRSGAFIGEGSLFTYTDKLIDTGIFDLNIKVDNIADPAKGVHLFNIVGEKDAEFSTAIYDRVNVQNYYGVFAPGNTFDLNFGTATLSANDSLRIIKRSTNTSEGVINASNLFSLDSEQDSVRAIDQTSGIFSLGYVNYPSLPGEAGRALSFDGTDDEVAIDSIPLASYNNFTIEFWIQQAPGSTGRQDIFSQSNEINNGSDAEVILASTLDGNPYFSIRQTDGGVESTISATQSIDDGEWHHVAYIRNDINLAIYIDGALDISSDELSTGAISFPANAEAKLSGDATVDEFRLWSSALNADDLKNYIYTNELDNHPNLADLETYYRFDEEVSADFLLDLAGISNGLLTDMEPSTDRITSGAFAVPANTVISLADNGPGSLRSLIELANLTPEMDTIRFDLPGAGPWEISILSQLEVTDSIYLDATTQPGWDFTTGNMVILDGTGNSNGIAIYDIADYVEIYGLKFENFSANALYLDNNLMYQSRIGDVDKGNIFINNNAALHMIGPDSTLIRNNLFGVDFDGTPAPNGSGIFMGGDANKNIVGGETTAANIIAYNTIGAQVNDPNSLGNLIRQNEFFCNEFIGILFDISGNGDIAAPAITSASPTEVSGTGIDGQEIDVYLANDDCDSDQGNSYLGTATVTGGVWTLGSLSLTANEFVTATANTIIEGTSAFASRFQIGEAPTIPTVDSKVTASLEPVLTGTFEDETELSVEINSVVYTLGTDTQLTAPDVGIWQLDLEGSALGDPGIYDIAVTSTNTVTGQSSVDITTDELTVVAVPSATAATSVEALSFTANWDVVAEVTAYSLDVSTDIEFTQPLPGFTNQVVTANSSSVTGLNYGTEYFYRVRAIAGIGDTTDYSNVVGVTTITGSGTIADSIALVALYNALDGVNWTNNTNWLQPGQRIETWAGVTLTEGRVTVLDLQGNNASGSVPTFTGEQLTELRTLLLNDNNISELSDLTGLSQLIDLQVQNNELIFSSLEANVGIPGFIYSPQQNVFEPVSNLVQEGTDITIERGLESENNVYSWLKNGTVMTGETGTSITLTDISFADEGEYVVRITNPLLPDLTLETEPYTLIVSSLERDQIALRNLYTQMSGSSWEGVNDWVNLPVTEWSNIVIAGNRVTELDLSNVGLAGPLSADILQVLNLSSINIGNNDVDSLPDLTSLVNLTLLDVSNNQLDFDDLIPNKDIPGLIIGTQRLKEADQPAIYIASQTDYTLTVETGGDGNEYQWFLNGVAIAGAEASSYEITAIGRPDMGTYSVEVSNQLLPGITLAGDIQAVFAKAKISGTARVSETELLTAGIVRLLQVVEGAYEPVDESTLDANGTFTFDTTLADYVVLVDPTNLEAFIPTYHISTIQWDEASVLILNTDTTNINVNMIAKPGDPTGGDGTFIGDVFTDFPEDGRIEARRRVRRVGVALRRRRSSGRPLDDEFDLFAYTETDDEGKFSFGNLPSGLYRIYIEFPGIPIKEDSFTEFEITEDGKNNDVVIEATVFEDGIEINGRITGVAENYLSELSIYPNPLGDSDLFVKVESKRGYSIRFELIDLRGKTVISKDINHVNTPDGIAHISTGDIQAGVYIIKVIIPELENQIYQTGKLIKK